MSLVPTQTVYSVRKGATGIVVWAVQRALNSTGLTGLRVLEDGVFGELTERSVLVFQQSRGIKADGVFGPDTSAKMASVLGRLVTTSVPPNLVSGFVKAESGALIGAVNASVPGGIDCGYVQRRVYEADYDNEAVVRRAFDGLYQLGLLARTLRGRKDAFKGRPGARTDEQAWRLAALAHNYPYAAEKISSEGVSNLGSYWTTPAGWVRDIGAKFADGTPVGTPLEWCQRYALGAPNHNDRGMTTQFVTDWIP